MLATLLAAIALGGCVSVQPMPLTPEAVEAALAVPPMAVLRGQAQEIRHPILRPTEITSTALLRQGSGGQAGLTPDEAAILAVLVNPSLRAARAERGLAAAQIIQAGILPNPTASMTVDFPLHAPGEVFGYDLPIEWEVSSLITRAAKLAAARNAADSVDLDIAWQEWQTAQAARLAVYRVVSLQAVLDLARRADQHMSDNAALVKKAVDQGMKTAVDQAAAEAAAQEAHTTVLEAQYDLRRQQLALNKALGLAPEAPVIVRAGLELPSRVTLPPVAEFLKDLSDRRLDLVALRHGYKSQESTVRAAVLGQFPKLSLGIHHTKDSGNFYTLGPSVAMDLPVFDRNQGAIALESATRQKLFDEYVSRVFDARAEIADFYAEIQSVQARLDHAQESVPVLARLVTTYESALADNHVDILSFYGAQADLAKRRIEVLKLKQELIDVRTELEISSGRYLQEPAAE
jgi:outer membrane protein TolC